MAADPTRTVLLTGASSGIGLEIANLLCHNGWEVWGTSRDLQRLPRLPHFHPIQMDMASSDSIRDGFEQAVKEAQCFDVLINNAGAGWFGPLELMSAEIVHEQFQVMMHGPLQLIRLVIPGLRQRQRGVIINISSLAAVLPIPFLGAYNASKAALSSISESLRLELAHTPIHVIDVRPGDINTNFSKSTKRVNDVLATVDAARMEEAWKTIDYNMRTAPNAQRVAERVWRLINSRNPPPVVTTGTVFQTKIAPVAARILPHRVMEWMLRRYYRV